jgi:hypothetical protein
MSHAISPTIVTVPRRLILQVTPRCNAACRHCAYDGGDHRRGGLRVELARALVDAFERRWGRPSHAGLTGGEPMLYPRRVLALAGLLASRGAVLRLLTNASWAEQPAETRRRLEELRAAGVAGLWVSASAFHAEYVPSIRVETLLCACAALGLPCYVNFTYLHPRGDAVRDRGLPEIDETIEADRRTLALHRAIASRHPEAGHGWARIWDLGRARALFDALGPRRAASARADLAAAASLGKGALSDLVGLGVGGEVFVHETVVGRSPGGQFARLLRAIHPARAHGRTSR